MDTELRGSEAGLAAYYQFDEGSGQAVIDVSRNGNNGIKTRCKRVFIILYSVRINLLSDASLRHRCPLTQALAAPPYPVPEL